jgi:hypothetical protein
MKKNFQSQNCMLVYIYSLEIGLLPFTLLVRINFKSNQGCWLLLTFGPGYPRSVCPSGKYLRLHNDVNTESICRVNMTPALWKSHKSVQREIKLVNQQTPCLQIEWLAV